MLRIADPAGGAMTIFDADSVFSTRRIVVLKAYNRNEARRSSKTVEVTDFFDLRHHFPFSSHPPCSPPY